MSQTLRRKATLPGLFVLWFAGAASSALFAQTVTTLQDTGSPAKRVDLVIVGDGYTSGELGKFATDVNTFLTSVWIQEPFREYRNYFNVRRLDVASNESGADHSDRSPQVFKDTAFDAAFNCNSIQRLICVNTTKVLNAISVLPPSQRDLILVIVNDAEYGGSGGTVSVASTHSLAAEIILHEFGHTLAFLADEYTAQPPTCFDSVEPSEANATKQSNRALVKWAAWIDAATPLPTSGTALGVPGIYTGSKYCPDTLYRPTYDSKMRTLGREYDQINTEQFVRRFYQFATPVDSYAPLSATFGLIKGQTQQFSVTTPHPATHSLAIAWQVDAQLAGTGAAFTFDTALLTPGSHHVVLTVIDNTLSVRSDPQSLLLQSVTWNITVTSPQLTIGKSGSGSGTVTSVPAGINCGVTCSTSSFAVGQAVTLVASADSGSIFIGWIGDADCIDGIVTMSVGLSCTAKFDLPQPGSTLTSGDFDSDHRTDVAVYRPSTGEWFVRLSAQGYSPAINEYFQWGGSEDVPVSGDFDGDLKTDVAVYRPSMGEWFIRLSTQGYSSATNAYYQWGGSGDVPVPWDFDGDGKSDIAVYRPPTGEWFIRLSSLGYSAAANVYFQWGGVGDVPVAGDFDGDRKADIAVYRPSTGQWFVRLSTQGYSTATNLYFQWGGAADTPVPGDFDGDLKSDVAVYRPSTGEWFIRLSSLNYSAAANSYFQWGSGNDQPIAGDFDGDGKADIIVYRPSTGEWFIRFSTQGYSAVTNGYFQWGFGNDLPLPR